VKTPSKPLQAEYSSNSDIWLLASTLPSQPYVLKTVMSAKITTYLQHSEFSDLSAFLPWKESTELWGIINAVLQGFCKTELSAKI